MSSAHLLRIQIEAALSSRIPSALTPAPRVVRPTAPTGITALDERLGGGLPVGAISELAGPECSGRTSLALSFIAGITQAARVCAWVDVSSALDPASAAAIGVDLDRLLWIRCGPQQLTLPGFDNIPEVANKQSAEKESSQAQPMAAAAKRPLAVGQDFQSFAPRCAEPQPTLRRKSREVVVPTLPEHPDALPVRTAPAAARRPQSVHKDWSRLDQALRVTDLLLQAGGFSAIVLDMGSIPPEYALRVPLATWFRYRAAAERTHASVLLLTQQACAKSSAGVVLSLQPGQVEDEGATVFSGAEYSVQIARERFADTTNTTIRDFARKPPRSDHSIRWHSQTPWMSPGQGRGMGRKAAR